jgi:excisionase family DNA binding protein
MSESLWTAADVAKLLGVSTDWIYAESRAGRIPTVRLGRYRRYRPEAIDQWLLVLEESEPRSNLSTASRRPRSRAIADK